MKIGEDVGPLEYQGSCKSNDKILFFVFEIFKHWCLFKTNSWEYFMPLWKELNEKKFKIEWKGIWDGYFHYEVISIQRFEIIQKKGFWLRLWEGSKGKSTPL